MRVSVLAIQKARFCALVLNEGFISCDVVSKGFGTRLEYLAKVNVSDVCLINYAICSAHDGTVVEYSGPLTGSAFVALSAPDP